MAAFLILPEGQRLRVTGPFDDPAMRSLLASTGYEEVPMTGDFEGEASEMWCGEDCLVSGAAYNEAATALRDMALNAMSLPAGTNPINGPVLVLTGTDRLP